MGVKTSKDDEIGALWQKTARDGGVFYTGTINGEDVILFENRYKKSDAHPHFRVCKARPRVAPAPVPTPVTDEDVPF